MSGGTKEDNRMTVVAPSEIATGFVSVFPRLVGDRLAVLAYIPVPSSHPRFGGAAVVGVVHGLPSAGLMRWAADSNTVQRSEELARWLVCVGWSTRIVKHPDTLWLRDVRWSVDLSRTIDLPSSYCGHNRLCVGDVTLEDPAVAEQARALLTA